MQKIAVVFPGQGSQFIGMYKGIYDEYEIVRETVNEAEKVTGVKISELCFNGPLSVLARPENAHIAIVAFGVAVFRVFVSETGLIPHFCAGHSLGEYTALVCAGAMNFSDALKLVQKRCEISKDVMRVSDGGMTIIDGVKDSVVENICRSLQAQGREVYVSCYNSDTQIAISGISHAIKEAEDLIGEEECTISPLFDSAPFHCPIMESGAKSLKELISKMKFRECRYPVMSNLTGRPYVGCSDYEENLLKHLTNPVKWNDIISYFDKRDIDLIIDFSAKNIFQNMIGDNKSFKLVCFGVKGEREELFNLLQDEKYRKDKTTFIEKSILAAVSTPNNNFDEKKYNDVVINKYKKLCKIRIELNSGEHVYSKEIKKNIISLLKDILEAKNISVIEQDRWIERILDETGSTYEQLT